MTSSAELPHPNFTFMFPFEAEFSGEDHIEWMDKNLYKGYIAVGLYILFIYFGPKFMKNKQAFELKYPLIMWNIFLGAYSIVGSIRTVPELVYMLQTHGLHRAVCMRACLNFKTCQYWAWNYVASKVLEMGDTVFLVLRKRQVMFLHWYHHITVLLLVWHCYKAQSAPSRWFGIVNGVIHSFMYSYFALKGLGIKIPRPISVILTLMQISQMFLGFYVSLFVFKQVVIGEPCDASMFIATFAVIVYSSYFVLFCRYFYMAYVVKDRERLNQELGLTKKSHKLN